MPEQSPAEQFVPDNEPEETHRDVVDFCSYSLKKLDRHFRGFFAYLENMTDIGEARKEVKQKKTISQEKLFEQLGL